MKSCLIQANKNLARGFFCMGSKQAVIIAEDDADILEIVSDILKSADFTVYAASDGKVAYDMVVKKDDVALLITDIVMPEIEGIELIRKSRLARPELKIIAMSGGGIGDKSTYLGLASRLGADGCIEKPFDSPTILDLVKKILG